MIPTPQNDGAAEVAAPTAPHPEANTFSTYQSAASAVNRPSVDLAHFPAELKRERIWCNWRYEIREDGKPTKVPYRDLVARAKSNGRETWITLECALANLENPNSTWTASVAL
jgi:hypothetical protein